jgi:hypothetical protein
MVRMVTIINIFNIIHQRHVYHVCIFQVNLKYFIDLLETDRIVFIDKSVISLMGSLKIFPIRKFF